MRRACSYHLISPLSFFFCFCFCFSLSEVLYKRMHLPIRSFSLFDSFPLFLLSNLSFFALSRLFERYLIVPAAKYVRATFLLVGVL